MGPSFLGPGTQDPVPILHYAFIKWLLQHEIRDKKHLILWLDNCTAQGENWILYTAFVSFINSEVTCLENMILKYFEKGHNFMSADSHGGENNEGYEKCF